MPGDPTKQFEITGIASATSLDDQWLMQGAAGARVAVDHNHRLWLGTVSRYFDNMGEGKKHWNSVGGSATFVFGR
ncbi:MAG: hypothetical protein M3Y57_21655 [Acidobacteriota bacterium]|nr:hypothetical protein [Acidobacteriota bacterium]